MVKVDVKRVVDKELCGSTQISILLPVAVGSGDMHSRQVPSSRYIRVVVAAYSFQDHRITRTFTSIFVDFVLVLFQSNATHSRFHAIWNCSSTIDYRICWRANSCTFTFKSRYYRYHYRGKIALILKKSVPYILHNFVNYNTKMGYRVAL